MNPGAQHRAKPGEIKGVTPQQREAHNMVAAGVSRGKVGRHFDVSIATVSAWCARVREYDRAQALARANGAT